MAGSLFEPVMAGPQFHVVLRHIYYPDLSIDEIATIRTYIDMHYIDRYCDCVVGSNGRLMSKICYQVFVSRNGPMQILYSVDDSVH